MGRYRLLAGQYYQADPDWKPSEEEKARAKIEGRVLRPPSRKYEFVKGKDTIVENDQDLAKRFGTDKFAYEGGGPQPAAAAAAVPADVGYTREDLEAMNVPDLKALAAEDEIDLKGATHKDEIVKAIHGAKGAKSRK